MIFGFSIEMVSSSRKPPGPYEMLDAARRGRDRGVCRRRDKRLELIVATQDQESVVYEGKFNESSKELQRTLQDASGHLRTESNRLIWKHTVKSRSTTSPCQGGCRGFDPRFPLQSQSM